MGIIKTLALITTERGFFNDFHRRCIDFRIEFSYNASIKPSIITSVAKAMIILQNVLYNRVWIGQWSEFVENTRGDNNGSIDDADDVICYCRLLARRFDFNGGLLRQLRFFFSLHIWKADKIKEARVVVGFAVFKAKK